MNILKYLLNERGIIPALIGAGGGILGGLFGSKGAKGAKKAQKAQTKALQEQTEASRQEREFVRGQRELFAPIQRGLLGAAQGPAMEAFRTELSPREREITEAQFGQARKGVLAGGQRGGLMQQMLGNVDLARAQAVSQAINQAKQLGIQRALGFTTGQLGGVPGAGAGLGGTAGVTGAAGELARQTSEAQGTFGAGLGGLLGQSLPGLARGALGLFGGAGAGQTLSPQTTFSPYTGSLLSIR